MKYYIVGVPFKFVFAPTLGVEHTSRMFSSQPKENIILKPVEVEKDTIMSIAGFIGKWTGATKVLTVAQKMFNIVMNANPIGLVIAGITALIGLGAAIVSFFKNNAAATKEETQALKDNYNEINENL